MSTTPPNISKALVALIATLGTVLGTVAGGLAAWFTISDRIEAKITRDVLVESRIVRLEEKLFAMQEDLKAAKHNP